MASANEAHGVLDLRGLGLFARALVDLLLEGLIQNRDWLDRLLDALRDEMLVGDPPQLVGDALHAQPRVPEVLRGHHVDFGVVLEVRQVVQRPLARTPPTTN